MMLHVDLAEAATKKVVLSIGQNVIVKTKRGDEVAKGTILGIDPDMKVLRVSDAGSGTDFQIDVDHTRYDIFVTQSEPELPLSPGENIMYTRIGLTWWWR